MTDQIPKAELEYLPLGSIMPFVDAGETPLDFVVLRGQTLTNVEFPALISKMWNRWNSHPGEDWAMVARDWWEGHGGVVQPNFVVLPVIEHTEIWAMSFNTRAMPKDAKPVLAIKAVRSLTNDG